MVAPDDGGVSRLPRATGQCRLLIITAIDGDPAGKK